MKLVYRDIDRHMVGRVEMIPEVDEDMWHTFNLIQIGDMLRASTFRKVQNESASGAVSSEKVRTTLTVQVEAIDFDTKACMLRVKGRNAKENAHVKMGAYHTVDLELNRKFSLSKHAWDSVALERVETATDPTQHADLAAVIMQEGLAYVCLITAAMTLVRAKIDTNIPRKRKGLCSAHLKGMTRFFEQVGQAVERHVNFDVVKAVLVASPGFIKDDFFKHLFQDAARDEKKSLLENRSKFVLCHSSSGHKHALREVLQDPSLTARLADTKAAGEVASLNDFFAMLQQDANRAFYGVRHVEVANESQAIETLLISDSLFRSNDLAQRRRYVALVDTVRENMGTVRIFSSLHISGEQLSNLTGVAAILRFPIPEPEDGFSGDSDSAGSDA